MHAIYERNTLLAPLDRQGDGADLGEMPVWNLDDLYPGPESPELEQDLAWLDEAASGFADEYANRLGELDADGLLGAIEAYQDIQIVVGRIGSFAGLRFAQNMGDPGRAKFQADMQDALTKATTHLVFVSLEVNRIPDAELEAKLMANPALARYRPLFRRLRAMRPHQLSDELEQFLHDQSVVGSTAWVRLFDETVATMKFNVDGADLGLEATLNFLSDTDRSKREAAARAIATGFKPQMPLFTRITNTLAKTKEIEDRWRRFEIPEASRHLSNDVEPAIVDALRDAVVAAYPDLSHRYYALKARWMGLDKLEVWDRNAPLPEQSDETIDWQEAKRIVVDAYRGFDPRLADLLLPFFEKGWIDAPVSEGKAPGAFAHPTVSSVHPYVLLNYLGKTRDVMTLAHELGHGVHQVLAADQGELLSSTPVDAGRNCISVWRNAHIPLASRPSRICSRTPCAAGGQSRGHDQHRGAPDRVLRLRKQVARRTSVRRVDHQRYRRDLDGRSARQPRTVVQLHGRV